MTQSESDQTTTKVHVQLLSPQADGPCARELTTGELRRYCNPEDLNFETTVELSGSTSHPGQDRAIAAINFGVDIDHRDYNIFALGGPGLGKQEIITSLIEEKAKSGPAPDDWCYVYNFEDENKPIALRFDTGDGAVFASEIENLVRELRSAIPAAFEGSDFQEQRQVILDDVKSRREKSFRKVQEEAERNELGLIQSPNAVLITP
ncbi:MAG: Lon-like protease helical domain-containing protein, partial [Pseudomonadota bacterium]